MSEDELREVNRIPPRMLVKAGSTLLVPRGDALLADVSEHIADNAMIALAPDAPPLRKRDAAAPASSDSVASVAKRYRVSAAQVAQWNDVGTGASFAPGQTIVVYVAGKARQQRRSRVDATARGTRGTERRAPRAAARREQPQDGARRQARRRRRRAALSAPTRRADARALSAGRQARARSCPGRRTRARCRSARRAPAA